MVKNPKKNVSPTAASCERVRLNLVLLRRRRRVKELREIVEQRVNEKRAKVLDQEDCAPRDLRAEVLEHELERLVVGRKLLQQFVLALDRHRLGRLATDRGRITRRLEAELLALDIVLALCTSCGEHDECCERAQTQRIKDVSFAANRERQISS